MQKLTWMIMCCCLWGCQQESEPEETSSPNPKPSARTNSNTKVNDLVDVEIANERDVEPEVADPKPAIIPLVAEKPVWHPVVAPRPWVISVPEKNFEIDPASGSLLVSFADLNLQTILNMRTIPPVALEYFPDWLNELDGKKVKIKGYMYPTYKDDGLKGFLFVRNPQLLTFTKHPRLDEIMTVILKDGTTTRYMQEQPFVVEGTFRILPWISHKTGELKEIYRIHDARVIP